LFATAWLIPRLPDFIASHPAIELVIESSTRRLDLDNDVFHAGVRVGDGKWPGLVAHHLMALQATPVVAPGLMRQLKLRRPADIARAATIHVSAFPLAWPMWLAQAGAGEARPQQTVWVDSFEAALQLAEQGAGVALGLNPLFAAREAAGTLSRPFDLSYPTGAYWLVHRPEEEGHPALRQFIRWLRQRLAADG
jgi:DNA-binding transcriptional LysR family regulator